MILFFVLFLSFVCGCLVAGAGLHDPDTCWQLALGKLLFDSGNLVQRDPYSYTLAATASHQFVMYQWLSNLIFYFTYKTAGLLGLVTLAAEVLAFSFIVYPLLKAHRSGALNWSVVLVITLGFAAASFHFLVRPEIWSYLFLALFLTISTNIAKEDKSTVGWIWAVTIFACMLIWCNLHSGFVLGIVLFALQAICVAADRLLVHPKFNKTDQTILLAFSAAVLGSLVNPYGVGLWMYLPNLLFPDFNKYIIELKPLTLADLGTITFVPYVILCGISAYSLFRSLANHGIKATGLFSLVLVVLAIGAGFAYRRLVPFSVIIQIMLFINTVTSRQNQCLKLSALVLAPLLALVVFAGTSWISTRVIPNSIIPQSSVAFSPPMKAIEYLKSNLPTGNMLNDPQFGDVMIMHMEPVPKLFIDTRFDMYGSQLVSDYHQMSAAEEGFERTLNSYNISWIFMPRGEELIDRLEHNPDWKTLYADDQAVILQRLTK